MSIEVERRAVEPVAESNDGIVDNASSPHTDPPGISLRSEGPSWLSAKGLPRSFLTGMAV